MHELELLNLNTFQPCVSLSLNQLNPLNFLLHSPERILWLLTIASICFHAIRNTIRQSKEHRT